MPRATNSAKKHELPVSWDAPDEQLDDRIGLRIPNDLKLACWNYAKRERRSLSNWVVDRLYEAIEKRDGKPLPRDPRTS